MASISAPFIPSREQLFNSDFAVSLSQSADVRDRFIDFFLSPICLRHDPCDRAAVTGDDESLAPLDIVQQLKQTGFGFGGWNLAHLGFLTSPSD